jgi:hypothetical protein
MFDKRFMQRLTRRPRHRVSNAIVEQAEARFQSTSRPDHAKRSCQQLALGAAQIWMRGQLRKPVQHRSVLLGRLCEARRGEIGASPPVSAGNAGVWIDARHK